MEFKKMINDLRQKAEVNPHQGLLFEADVLKDTPCNGCLENGNKGFEWRGNNVRNLSQ